MSTGSKPTATLSAQQDELGPQLEAQTDLGEVVVTGENLGDPQVLHDDHRGEVDEGDVRLVVIALPHLPSLVKLTRRNMDKPVPPTSKRLQQIADKLLRRGKIQNPEQQGHELGKDKIGGDVPLSLLSKQPMLMCGR